MFRKFEDHGARGAAEPVIPGLAELVVPDEL
jgi:hypothetical protein